MCAMPYPSHVDGAGTDPHASRSDGADSADGLAGAAGILSSGANKGAGKGSGKGPDKGVGVGAGKGTAQTIGNTRGKVRHDHACVARFPVRVPDHACVSLCVFPITPAFPFMFLYFAFSGSHKS